MELYFKNKQEWRKWLEENHSKATELWLVYFKKHTKMPSVSYAEAVEEALCFGWIDGIVKSIDAETYMQRFTPRKPKSTWSKVNKERCLKLIEEGKMTEAGLRLIEEAKKSGWWENAYQTSNQKVVLSDNFKVALKQNPKAESFFLSLTDGQKNQYIRYIESAKRKETKLRRIDKVIERLEKKMKPGMT
jgi:uncharacterized protein YdeI (YjbR/CyaY-like superfamily)